MMNLMHAFLCIVVILICIFLLGWYTVFSVSWVSLVTLALNDFNLALFAKIHSTEMA